MLLSIFSHPSRVVLSHYSDREIASCRADKSVRARFKVEREGSVGVGSIWNSTAFHRFTPEKPGIKGENIMWGCDTKLVAWTDGSGGGAWVSRFTELPMSGNSKRWWDGQGEGASWTFLHRTVA